jgi:outer membrane protein TolC
VSARESFGASLERYRDGAADVVELIQSQSTLVGARGGVVQARTSLYDAYAELVHAVGTDSLEPIRPEGP